MMYQNDEFDNIVLLINKTREITNNSFDKLISICTSSSNLETKEYVNKTNLRKKRRELYKIKFRYKLITRFVYKCISAFHIHCTLKLDKFDKIERAINLAESEMWIKLKEKKR